MKPYQRFVAATPDGYPIEVYIDASGGRGVAAIYGPPEGPCQLLIRGTTAALEVSGKPSVAREKLEAADEPGPLEVSMTAAEPPTYRGTLPGIVPPGVVPVDRQAAPAPIRVPAPADPAWGDDGGNGGDPL